MLLVSVTSVLAHGELLFRSDSIRSCVSDRIVHRVQKPPSALSGSLQQRTSVLLDFVSVFLNSKCMFLDAAISDEPSGIALVQGSRCAALQTWEGCSCINGVLSQDLSPYSCTAGARTFPAELQSFTSWKDRLYDEPVKLYLHDVTGLWPALPLIR